MNQPIVTVGVLTYNSSEYIVETLESIKKQTYPHLILQISDDCSTDNTIELCKIWINKNKERFIKTKIIVPEHNTGVSGNANRDWDACETEWLKEIAGDDILLPNCIEDNIKYVEQQSDAIIIFSRPRLFGVSERECEQYIKKFDFSIFDMNSEQQYERIRYKNCLPASTAFYNIKKNRSLGLRHDERIPNLEDKPKWINAAKMGIKFHFFDKETVGYRIHKDSLSSSKVRSPRFYESLQLCYFYYVFQPLYEQNPEQAIQDAVSKEMYLYNNYYKIKIQKKSLCKKSYFKFVRFIKNYKIRNRQ